MLAGRWSASAIVYKLEKLTLFLICLGVSFRNIEALGSLADILSCAPCNAGRKVECTRDGLGNLSLAATSRVIRKYGSWSIAHGTRQGS